MLVIRNWQKWQGRGIDDVRRQRAKRGSKDKPYAMGWICVAASLDEHFAAFASVVGGARAETYLVRFLQYVALHDAFGGTCGVPRNVFGPVVLTREWDLVSSKTGAVVFDALIIAHVAELSGTRPELVPDVSENRPAPPVLSCPGEAKPVVAPPSAAGPGQSGTAGATASASPLTASEVAGLRAMAGVFRLKANGHPDAEAARARKLMDELAAGTADPAEARAWRDMRFAITDARVAYLAAYAGSPKAEEA